MGSIGFAIAITLALMIANGFFAAAEIAIVSARHSRLQQQINEGKKGAQQALNLARNSDRFLATVQIGMTLINTLAAAFSGASLSAPLANAIKPISWLAPYATTLSLAIVVILVTYFELIIGELVPKRLALQSAENVAANAAPFMTALARVAAPLVTFLNGSVNVVLSLLGRRQARKERVTEEDIVYLTHQGIVSGTVEKGEEELISRVFRFTDRNVSDVMKPRTEMVAVEVGTPRSQVTQTFLASGYTRIPLYQNSLDNIVGVLYAKDLLKAHPEDDENVDLLKLARPPFFVPEYQHVDALLATFRRRGIHLAIAIDEYSQVVGLITLEDVLEELVGEIQDEYDMPEDKAIVQREDGSWLVDGMLDRETVQEKIGLQPPDEDDDYHTLAGMILNYLGRIPTVGDTVTIDGFVLEVVDMDGRRIDRVLIRPKK
ncbi:MAG TPA: hemolysin family protein [Ktedonobacteraceae bacterium]|nr:hemolysin family protein [Ktedonobacteraceae bacterium]